MTDVDSRPASHNDTSTAHFLDDDVAAMLADALLGPAPGAPALNPGDRPRLSPPSTIPWPLSAQAIAATKALEFADAMERPTIAVLDEPAEALALQEASEPIDVIDVEIATPASTNDGLHYVMCAIVVAVGFVLRVVNLAAVGLNSDEAVYAGQGGALLGVGELDQHFSIFRAHPLLLQFVSGAVFQVTGPSDHAIRLVVSVFFGLGSVVVTYLLGRRLYGRNIGLAAAAVLAVLPYHVIVSRQVLVDTPMAFFVTLAALAAVRAVQDNDGRRLYFAFFWCALAAISKEIAVLMVPVLAMWLVTGPPRIAVRRLIGPCLLFAVIGLPFPLTRLINQPGNASQFFLWQFTRKPNHDPDYFAKVILQFGGWAFLGALLAGILALAVRRWAQDQFLLWWLGSFGLFFQFWPTKLFPYLYVILPAMALAAAVAVQGLISVVGRRAPRRSAESTSGGVGHRARSSVAFGAVMTALVLSLSVSSAGIVSAGPAAELEGFGDFDIEVQTFAGSREFGEWAGDHTPVNSRFLTIGPSLGNILRFYGYRDSVALSVSPDPARRNPAYVPVANPDLAMRQMSIHYVAWDAYSADRSAFYNNRIRGLARKLGGEIVFSVYADDGDIIAVEGPPPDGADVRIVVWDVPGAGSSTGGSRQEGLS